MHDDASKMMTVNTNADIVINVQNTDESIQLMMTNYLDVLYVSEELE